MLPKCCNRRWPSVQFMHALCRELRERICAWRLDEPGTLQRNARYLLGRTDGMIGSLSHLVRGAAIEAILDGSEKITKRVLETIDLDHAAQHPGTARS